MLVEERGLLCQSGGLACEARDLELTTVFSVANVALLISSLPIGFVMEWAGPKRIAVLGNAMVAIGCFVIAGLYDPADVIEDGQSGMSRPGVVLLVGFLLISFFGPALQVATMSSSFLFPGKEATIVGLLSGAMGGSAIVFPLYSVAHTGQFRLEGVFWFHGAVSLAMGVINAFLLPLEHFDTFVQKHPSVTEDDAPPAPQGSGEAPPPPAALRPASVAASEYAVPTDSADWSSANGEAASAAVPASEKEEGDKRNGRCDHDAIEADVESSLSNVCLTEIDGRGERGGRTGDEGAASPGGDVAPATTLSLVSQPWFLALVFWNAVQYLRLVFWLGTADLRLRAIASSRAEAEHWLAILGWMAPLGILIAPVAGWLQDRYGNATAMAATQVLGIVHAAFSLIPALEAQPVTFLTYTWQQEASFAIVLAAVVGGFGAAKSGIGSGLVLVLGAACSAIVTPMTAGVLHAGQGFMAVDFALLALTLLSALLPVAQCCGARRLLPPQP